MKTEDKIEQILSSSLERTDFADRRIELREHDGSTFQVFLYVDTGFTDEHRRFLEGQLQEQIYRKTLVSIIYKEFDA